MTSKVQQSRPTVLICSGLDPSGGAGMNADITATMAMGAHPLSVITALTVQDNNRVYGVSPVDTQLLTQQINALIQTISIDAVKIGIVGNAENAQAILKAILTLRQKNPNLPVVLDTVLGSGLGDSLSQGSPTFALSSLLPVATLITPNLPEASRLVPQEKEVSNQAKNLLNRGIKNVLIKGGHGSENEPVENCWFYEGGFKSWTWPRLPGEYHGTGCTLASAIAALLAKGLAIEDAIYKAQQWTQQTLANAYSISKGQKIPNRAIR